MFKVFLFLLLSIFSFNSYAQPSAPRLQLDIVGQQITLNWLNVDNAKGYRLSYAAYPFLGLDTIHSIDLGLTTEFAAKLWQDAAFYVALQAYDAKNEHSDYSNIGFILIKDRGEEYRNFWQTLSKDIDQKTFLTDDFLYAQLPDIAQCRAGELRVEAQLRSLKTINATRQLHQLAAIADDNQANNETQQASLIQRANNFLSHTPATSSNCYSQAGYDGSSSSNLHLGSVSSDPANDILGFINDANNVSTVAGVGHRRALLNPFLALSSYGQVLGGSAVKVLGFESSAVVASSKIPDFVAFPYLHYPYLFLNTPNSPKKTPWSFSLIEDKSSLWANRQAYFSNSTVQVRQKETGKLLAMSNLHADTSGVGVPNNLSWTVDNWQYDTWYSVTIENINYQSGELGSIQYDVFIDYKNLIDITQALEEGDQQDNSSVQGTLFDDNDQDSYQVELAGQVEFIGNSQFSNMAFFMAVYDANKQLLAVDDESFSLDLAAGEYTLLISNCKDLTCYREFKKYTVQMR